MSTDAWPTISRMLAPSGGHHYWGFSSTSGENIQLCFQSEAVYQRGLRVKRKLDPSDVVTSNPFCVGACRKLGGGSARADGEAARAIPGGAPDPHRG